MQVVRKAARIRGLREAAGRVVARLYWNADADASVVLGSVHSATSPRSTQLVCRFGDTCQTCRFGERCRFGSSCAYCHVCERKTRPNKETRECKRLGVTKKELAARNAALAGLTGPISRR